MKSFPFVWNKHVPVTREERDDQTHLSAPELHLKHSLSLTSPFLSLSSPLSIYFLFCGLPTFSFPNLFWFLFSFLHSSYFSYIHASVNMTWYNLHNISQNKRATIPIRDSPVTNYGLGNISSILRLWPFTPHFLILSMDWWDKYHCSIDTFKEGQISLIIRPIIYLKALRLVQPATPLPKKQETEKNLYWCLHL